MSFLEDPRFPDDVAYGFTGGPLFNTNVVPTRSGFEQRIGRWGAALGRWTATHRNKSQAQTDLLIAFFRAVNGRAHGFRFKDWADFLADNSSGILTLISAGSYQLKKRYTAGVLTHDRTIAKPVSGTITIAGGGTYTLDSTTGIVTHSAGPAPTSWAGQFDVPARFDSDELQVTAVTRSNGLLFTWENAEIVEIRV